ncbi:MAG: F0F1 ATP synthase subunit epsilon [Bacteroidota bacterium]
MTSRLPTTIQLTVTTPDQTFFEGRIAKATFPGTAGPFQVLHNHAPLVSTLQRGTIVYHDGEQENSLPTETGIVEVLSNQITVLMTTVT